MHWNHEVGNVGLEGGSRFDDLSPVRVVVMEGSLVVSWAAVVAFELR